MGSARERASLPHSVDGPIGKSLVPSSWDEDDEDFSGFPLSLETPHSVKKTSVFLKAAPLAASLVFLFFYRLRECDCSLKILFGLPDRGHASNISSEHALRNVRGRPWACVGVVRARDARSVARACSWVSADARGGVQVHGPWGARRCVRSWGPGRPYPAYGSRGTGPHIFKLFFVFSFVFSSFFLVSFSFLLFLSFFFFSFFFFFSCVV